MPDTDRPQIYLVTPAVLELSDFSRTLSDLLDTFDIACLRISLASSDIDEITRSTDHLREICHKHEIATVIDSHYKLVTPLGLDGVHLPDGAKNLRAVRKDLGADPIVGAFCGNSRHNGMTAGEMGADYICFGPVTADALGAEPAADFEIFELWSEMVELPVVAEGKLTLDSIETLAPVVDWFALRDELWDAPEGAKAKLTKIIDRLH